MPNLEPKLSQSKQPAGLLKTADIIFLLALLLAFKIIFSVVAKPGPIQALDLTSENIAASVERERELRNMASLNYNTKLAQAAQLKAEDMINRHYFSHTDPEGNYIWPSIVAQGYNPYLQLGENLAIDFYNTESLVAAWMNSPTHRANILNEGFKDQGVGLSFGNVQKGTYYSAIVNTFGALLIKSPPAPQVESSTSQQTPQAALPPTENQTDPKAAQDNPQPSSTPAFSQTPKSTSGPLSIRDGDSTLAPSDSSTASATPPKTTTAPAVSVPSQPNLKINPYKLNRQVILTLGAVLLIILIADLKSLLEKKILPLDKKINNLVVLIIALIVVALMYWL